MARIPLTGGAYTARSVIANAQRSVNLYAERNGEQDEAPAPVTHYPCPGLTLLTQPSGSRWRGLYFSTVGFLFGVLDQTLYRINQDWTLLVLGTVLGGGNSPVSMTDNGISLVVVTGPNGYTVNLTSMAFAQLLPAGNFQGSDRVDFLDTYLIFNRPGTRQWYTSLSNTTTFDPTYVVAKSVVPDLVQGVLVNRREILIVGTRNSEVWYDAGGVGFPFAILPGSGINQGTVAKYSLCCHDTKSFWIGQNKDGNGIALLVEGYQAKRISTPAIEAAWAEYPTLSDAISMTYQQSGHVFWVVTFPTADKTWVYDVSTNLWHERVWLDSNGQEHRHRANCMTLAYGKIVVGDWENGKLYYFDLNNFTDDGQPMTFRRGFPHIVNDGKRISYSNFEADIETGTNINTGARDPQIFLRWSDSRGNGWGDPVGQVYGTEGSYRTFPKWERLGMARDMVFELFWSTDRKTALQGAFVDATPVAS